MDKDKQIIIDGIEVKDCIAYAKSQTVYLGNTVYKQMEKICMVKNQPCKFFDCQFKQMARELKAKEQECEELKKIINEAKNSKLDLNSFFAIEATVGEYQLELDQLKAEKQGLIKDWEEKKNLAYEIACKNEKLKATLTEIKEIAEHGKRFAERYMITGEQKANVLTYANAILQKISEVEE